MKGVSKEVAQWAKDNLTAVPPPDCVGLQVGMTYTYTNENGRVFDDCTIIGFARTGEDLYGANVYFVPPNDDGAYWFPSPAAAFATTPIDDSEE